MRHQVVLLLVAAACAVSRAIVVVRQSDEVIRVWEGPTVAIDVALVASGPANLTWFGPDRRVLRADSKDHRLLWSQDHAGLRIRRVDRYRSGEYALLARDRQGSAWVNTTVEVQVKPIAHFEIVLGVGAEKRNVLLNKTSENSTCFDKQDWNNTSPDCSCVVDPREDKDHVANLTKSQCGRTRNTTHKNALVQQPAAGTWKFSGCNVTVGQHSFDKCTDVAAMNSSAKQMVLREALLHNDLDTVHTVLLAGANASGGHPDERPLDRLQGLPMLFSFLFRIEDARLWRDPRPFSLRSPIFGDLGLAPSRAVCMDIPRVLLEANATVEARDVQNRTVLHYASMVGHVDFCRFALQAGAQVDALDAISNTPLHYTAFHGTYEVAKLLLQNGARVDALNERDITALYQAAMFGSYEVAVVLLQAGARVDGPDNGKSTPLHEAALYGQYKVAELLLQNGARVDALSSSIRTPLHFAAYYGKYKVAEVLLQHGARVDVRDGYYRTPLAAAQSSGHQQVATVIGKWCPS